MLQNLIGPIASVAGKWMEGRQKKAELKAKLEEAKVNAKVRKIEQDGDWEVEQARNSADSWKDELYTIFFVVLMSACFYPPAQPYIEDGFRFLREDCPEWLTYGILASIAASFGLKSITKFKG